MMPFLILHTTGRLKIKLIIITFFQQKKMNQNNYGQDIVLIQNDTEA